MGRLDVRVCAARNLSDTEVIGKPDPYAVVKLENQQHKTRTIDNSTSPVWDEVFKFTIADESSSQLRVELWNKNLMSDEFLGQYSISLSGLTKGVVKDGWYLLQQSKTNAELHVRLLALDFGAAPPAGQPVNNVQMNAPFNPSAPVYNMQQQQQYAPPPQQYAPPPMQQQQYAPPPQQYAPPPQQYPPQQQFSAPPPQQQFGGYPQQGGYGGGDYVELINAWYGTEHQHGDNNGRVDQQIRENIQRNGGRIVLDGNLFGLFGFDPAFGQHKCCAMHVRYRGQEHHLRAQEAQPFTFPQQGGYGGGDRVELINAWYGTEHQNGDNGGRVDQQIRENIQRNNGRIVLDGNLFGLFQFDPAYGQHKCCAMHVRYRGQEHHLRAQEGQYFQFPN